MTQEAQSLFESGIERYKAGESPDSLIPLFKEVCSQSPKNGAAYTCLSWLYLLQARPEQAQKAAQKAVKLNPTDPQARVNLAIAMLETKQTGVRQQIEAAQQLIATDGELRDMAIENLEDGLSKKPDWESLKRVKSWLFN